MPPPERRAGAMPRLVTACLAMLTALDGCILPVVPASVEETEAPVAKAEAGEPAAPVRPLAPGEVVVVVAAGPQGTEQAAARQVRERIAARAPAIRQLDAEEFHRAFYPWFQPGWASRDPSEFRRAMDVQAVRDRVMAMRLRYLIEVRDSSKTAPSEVSSHVVGVPTIGGLLPVGIGTGKDRARYAALIWDLMEARAFDEAAAQTAAGSGMVVVGLPIAVMSPNVGWRARDELAAVLVAFLEGRPPPATAAP
jgi:hypothetical protein